MTVRTKRETMKTLFTSDSHFGHFNIIKYTHRPFSTIEEMNENLIFSWNSVVDPDDTVYHLGDFTMGSTEYAISILKRLNGKKCIVLGNHDKALRKAPRAFDGLIEWMKDYAEVSINGQLIIMCHYPFSVWNQSHRGAWDLHGHCHNTHNYLNTEFVKRLDVGVDNFNYAPVSFEKVKEIMDSKTFKPIDHHVQKDDKY